MKRPAPAPAPAAGAAKPKPKPRKKAAAARAPTQRQLRVAEEVRHVLAGVFNRGEFRDPELAAARITVTEVRISPDLKHATAFVARLGRSDIEALLPALTRAASYLRTEVGHALRLRVAPDLHFQPDETIEYAVKIDRLLHRPEVARDLSAPRAARFRAIVAMSASGTTPQMHGLFPTPLLIVPAIVPAALRATLVAEARAAAAQQNARSGQLSHTDIATDRRSPATNEALERARPALVAFGAALFGEELDWSVKEVWTNVLEPGGHQSVHAHANSFISGVIYLTPTHPSASTVFLKGLGGSDYSFVNQNPRATIGPFNAGKWIMPEVAAGDMVLFPSYLLHEVPRNDGQQRVSMAFNAIPDRLNSFGYTIRFSG